MSSYLNIYIKPENEKPLLAFYFSRNNPVYQAINENVHPVFVDKLDCKEWYANRHKGVMFKHVATRAEAIEPIPENVEYNKFIEDWNAGKKVETIPEMVYRDYFVQEIFDSLPSKAEMIEKDATELHESVLEEVIDDLNNDISKAVVRRNEIITNVSLRRTLNEYFPERAKEISDEKEDLEDWDDYIDELKCARNQIAMLAHNKTLGTKLYCYVD